MPSQYYVIKPDGVMLVKCKFCHQPCHYDSYKRRFYEVDKVTLHVDNCPARRQFYSDMAFGREEAKRQLRK